MQNEMVRVLNLKTKEVFTMPASELASGMLKIKIEGQEGEFWVNAADIRDAPYRHPPFDAAFVEKFFKPLKAALDEVYPRTLEQWEDGFRRDANPEQEIAIMFKIAGAYKHYTEGRWLSPEQKQDIFAVILSLVNNGADYVLKTTSPRTLSRKRVKEMVEDMLSGKVKPLEVPDDEADAGEQQPAAD